MKAVRCPVCAGTGEYWENPPKESSALGHYRTCHGCNGKGWVEVHGELAEGGIVRHPGAALVGREIVKGITNDLYPITEFYPASYTLDPSMQWSHT